MTSSAARFSRRRVRAAAVAGAILAGCSSGTGHGLPPACPVPPGGVAAAPSVVRAKPVPSPSRAVPPGAPPAAGLAPGAAPSALGCDVAPALPAGQPFTLSGTARYELVPASYNPTSGTGGLAFASARELPVREADVKILQCGAVLTATTTDAAGSYTVTFTPGALGEISVNVLARTANPPIQVVDNTAGGAIWTVAQPVTSASPTLDVLATHGWAGASYGPGRIAAPFAILDDLYVASHRLLDLPRAIPFASYPLTVNWSPANAPTTCGGGTAAGCIGTSYYDPGLRQIFVLGADGVDTDEFDREVVIHEWGHYFQDTFSASNSPGDSHGLGDVLDPRLAFDEGAASALAAMLLQDRIYADTFWAFGRQDAFGWDVETRPPFGTDDPLPGPFSELSVIRAMWDLYDSGTNEASDVVALGLGPIYDTLVGPQRTTPALTTIASFVAGLKELLGNDPATNAGIDAVLASYSIGPITSPFGAGDPDLEAMFARVTVPSAVTVALDANAWWNQQAQNRYFVLTAPGTHVTVSSASAFDVDLYAYSHARLLAGAESTSGYETIGFATVPNETYVVVLTGFGGITDPVPPPGVYCPTVTFASP